ncbi:MAG: DUF763 domain-containing protein [Candidatus Nealsonbacteria bacterium CG_4_10_14_3_um_filter_36_16]|uniref:DUF763 domain-containing protein n=1 Tax=Candidatus Nealsonbacteria bacterium CG_4_10_14_3_um_filter_36_16 TaxID=1974685 RepID=A0A2M7MF58_9BACT|nr:MAG: DUF763 domain-containing protein [Candidatus Nealsonbacteria bacterium CG_4_10_14_3_um_filter_36_16]
MRTGVATIPLDYGKCPYWLFERMKRLARGIVLAIVEEFGIEEVLRRLSDPVWFQSLACVIGFDWNSSGATTTTMGALKEGLRGLQSDLGLFICGGKGKTSRKTPEQIQNWGEFLGWPMEKIDKLVYASKISAKVDSNLIQDGYQLYHHNLIFSKSGQWAVVQQGMREENSTARRYHWLSSNVRDFVEEPHSGIISDIKVKPLNLTAKKSRENKEISTELVKEEPKTFLKDIKLISQKSDTLIRQQRIPGFVEMELKNVEFHWHPVLKEKFDLKRLEKTIFAAHFENPENFEKLLSLKGVGPKTIRALSLVSEIIYGARPSYEDPSRYSFAHGGKDSTPFPVSCSVYDKTLEIMEKGIKKSKISKREKIEAQRRLKSLA